MLFLTTYKTTSQLIKLKSYKQSNAMNLEINFRKSATDIFFKLLASVSHKPLSKHEK